MCVSKYMLYLHDLVVHYALLSLSFLLTLTIALSRYIAVVNY